MLLLCSIACAIDPTGTILEIKLPNSNRHVVFPVTAKELNDQLRDYPWLTHLPVGKASWQIWDIGNGSDARVYNLRADRTLRVAIIGKTNDYSFFLFYGRCDGKPPAYPRFVMVKTLDEVLVQFGAFVSNEFAELDKLYTENGKPLQELPVDLFEPTKPPSISLSLIHI